MYRLPRETQPHAHTHSPRAQLHEATAAPPDIMLHKKAPGRMTYHRMHSTPFVLEE